MKQAKLVLAVFGISSLLVSCSSAVQSVEHQGKHNPCFFSDKKGTLRPYKTNEDRVTEHYHFRNALEKE
jgi:hypothetical protein